jgi:hypothetical protein
MTIHAPPKGEDPPVVRENPDGSEITLFRYFSPEKLPSFLQGRLFLTPPKYLNDPFEFAIGREFPNRGELETMFDGFVRNEYEALFKSHRIKVPLDDFRRMKSTVREKFIARTMSEEFKLAEPEQMQTWLSGFYGLICLTETPDNPVMWGHYCDSYKGFVAEFACLCEQATHVPKVRLTPFGLAFQVLYASTQPLFNRDFSNGAQCYSTKINEWSYEREWRVIERLDLSECIKTTDGRCYAQFPPTSLRRIVLGHQMTAVNKSEMLKLANKDGFERVRFQKTHPNSAERRVELQDIA